MKKGIENIIWLCMWTPLGTILGGFWRQVGKQVGTKLAPKSGKLWSQDDVEKSSQIWSRGGSRGAATRRCSGHLRSYNPDNFDNPDCTDRQSKALWIHPSGQLPGGGYVPRAPRHPKTSQKPSQDPPKCFNNRPKSLPESVKNEAQIQRKSTDSSKIYKT